MGVKPLNLFSRGCNFFFQGLPGWVIRPFLRPMAILFTGACSEDPVWRGGDGCIVWYLAGNLMVCTLAATLGNSMTLRGQRDCPRLMNDVDDAGFSGRLAGSGSGDEHFLLPYLNLGHYALNCTFSLPC